MKKFCAVFLPATIAWLLASQIRAEEYVPMSVTIGLTSVQPPFVINTELRQGLAYTLTDFLNSKQERYRFNARMVPVKRLLSYDKDSGIHLIAFNDINWGWKERNGVGSLPLTHGSDRFFSTRTAIDDEHKGTIAAVRGFHYAFADFSESKLESLSHVRLAKDELGVIRLVEHGRTELGVVSNALLNWLKVSIPDRVEKLSIRQKPDHHYQRQMIVLPSSPISVEELNELLLKLKGEGMDQLFQSYGLEPPPLTFAR